MLIARENKKQKERAGRKESEPMRHPPRQAAEQAAESPIRYKRKECRSAGRRAGTYVQAEYL